ncbi:hypothetical protein [Streptomyces sp. bgisy032]|uniref:hypothetical protein n=1 Tax=Streptomyces sp. bgisy032 TaxID=3413773 RepID=UPI003D75CBC9
MPTIGAIGMPATPDMDRERFFRQLMVYGGSVVAVVPAVARLVTVVPGRGRAPVPRNRPRQPRRSHA